MQKLLKSGPPDRKMSAPSFIHARGDNVDNQMWHDTCDAVRHKFNTVVPVHSPLSPPTKAFLKNYDDIDWHRKEDEKEKVEV